jgi:hypothetical protein
MPEHDELRDDAGERRSILPDLILNRVAPTRLPEDLVKVLNSTDEPDPTLCRDVGCGDLESLLRENETALWSDVERLARMEVRFRRALSSVWAYDSPEYERRDSLLAELGEPREITMRFTVQHEDFSPNPVLSWRAFEAEGSITNRRLAEWICPCER